MTIASMSNEDLDVCTSTQQEEWQVLHSIYPDCIQTAVNEDTLEGPLVAANAPTKVEIPIEFDRTRTVEVVDDGSLTIATSDLEGRKPDATQNALSLTLPSLPSMLLELILPPEYPLHTPPRIVSLHATHSWMNRTHESMLKTKLLKMWDAGESVLYNWVEYIRTGDFLGDIGLLQDDIVRLPHPYPPHLTTLLTSHSAQTLRSHFSTSTHPCSICLSSLKGSKCIQLNCSHVFCRACLTDYWGLAVKEGDIGQVRCPDEACVKLGEKGEAGEEEVRRVLGEDEVMRWKWLREKRDLDRDPTIVHCPLDFCQTPVPRPRAEDGSGWDRLRTCTGCGYSFCAFCRRTWHGPHTSCLLPLTATFILNYLAAPEGSEERNKIEQRYGRNNVKRLVKEYEEERRNREWMDSQTTGCPNCEIKVEKSAGCNHMTCARCKTHFCYRCGQKLNAANPYPHFSTPGFPCYSKLFDFESGEDEWQPIEGFEDL